MNIGVFTQYIRAQSIEELADRVAGHGLRSVVLDTYPGLDIDLTAPSAAHCRRIRAAFEHAGVSIAAVGAYQNLVHPDPQERQKVYDRMNGMVRLCEGIGSPMVCTETGSFHPNGGDWEPSNLTDRAIDLLAQYVAPLLDVCRRSGVTLSLEPYVMTVTWSADRLATFIDRVGRERVQAVYDPAGILTRVTLDDQEPFLRESFRAIEPHLGLVHVQDVTPATKIENHFNWQGAGTGVIDYPLFLDLVAGSGYEGPLILEFLREEQIPTAVEFVRDQWTQAILRSSSAKT